MPLEPPPPVPLPLAPLSGASGAAPAAAPPWLLAFSCSYSLSCLPRLQARQAGRQAAANAHGNRGSET